MLRSRAYKRLINTEEQGREKDYTEELGRE